MKRLNFKMIIGVIINAVITLIFQSEIGGVYDDIVGNILWGVIAINLVGILLVLLDISRIGAWIIIISSALYIPIGCIGIYGGTKLLGELEQEEIDSD